jgi:hypothetical protein
MVAADGHGILSRNPLVLSWNAAEQYVMSGTPDTG